LKRHKYMFVSSAIETCPIARV